jgi:hypothetical protein
VGLIGFVVYCLWCFRQAYNANKLGYHFAAWTIMTVIVTYWAYGIFEGRAINAGNPLSACFFLLTLASSTVNRSLKQ